MTAEDDEARSAADRLALALEDAGFDVGQDFPALQDTIGRRGAPVVRLGDVQPSIANRGGGGGGGGGAPDGEE